MFPPPPHVAKKIAKDLEGAVNSMTQEEALGSLFVFLAFLSPMFVFGILWVLFQVSNSAFSWWVGHCFSWIGYVVFNSKDYY